MLLVLVTLAAWGVSHLFAGRAEYIQIGAMLGTMMAGNVFFTIIPAHWELIRAKQAGREPSAAAGLRAKQRSVHNNYLTLPVVFTMISNHFPITYGHSHSWLILVALLVIGAWMRHFFNLRHTGRTAWWIPLSAALAIAAVAIAIRPHGSSGGTPVPCHSAHPTKVSVAPLGLVFDTAKQIHAQASLIEQVAVRTKVMPLGNQTGMTQAERDALGAWIEQGAKTR